MWYLFLLFVKSISLIKCYLCSSNCQEIIAKNAITNKRSANCSVCRRASIFFKMPKELPIAKNIKFKNEFPNDFDVKDGTLHCVHCEKDLRVFFLYCPISVRPPHQPALAASVVSRYGRLQRAYCFDVPFPDLRYMTSDPDLGWGLLQGALIQQNFSLSH